MCALRALAWAEGEGHVAPSEVPWVGSPCCPSSLGQGQPPWGRHVHFMVAPGGRMDVGAGCGPLMWEALFLPPISYIRNEASKTRQTAGQGVNQS